jgi:hypothetical protein
MMALVDCEANILSSLIRLKSNQEERRCTSSRPREAENNPIRNKIRGRNMLPVMLMLIVLPFVHKKAGEERGNGCAATLS